jgi:hypothetical protein
MLLTRRALALTLSQAAVTPFARAATSDISSPKGKTILTVSGRIGRTNRPGIAEFDRDMMEALGTSSFTTMTPWHDEPAIFEGVLMSRLMQAVAASGTLLTVRALNDYTTEIPISDFHEHAPIMAMRRNGAYMPPRDKGPLFIVYPFDSDPALQNRRYYSRSAWQVCQLVIS